MKFIVCAIVPFLLSASVCAAAPTLTTPVATSVSAGMATLALKSDSSGTGYFTLLPGSGAACGTGAQVAAGLDSSGAPSPRLGSLPLVANVAASYTIRDLVQSSSYTFCFTADSPSGGDLNQTPVSAGFTTPAATVFTSPDWVTVGSAGFSPQQVEVSSLAIAPDGTPYVAFAGNPGVMKFSDGVWSGVGALNIDYRPFLAFSPDGTPHVVFSDSVNKGLSMMKFTGSDWSAVGTLGFSQGIGGGRGYSLAFAPDGTPYVAFYSSQTPTYTVMKYTGGAWGVVGGTIGQFLAVFR
jgi:hypothetical protein